MSYKKGEMCCLVKTDEYNFPRKLKYYISLGTLINEF